MSDDALLVEGVIAGELDADQQVALRARLEDPAFVKELAHGLILVGALRASRDAAKRDAELQAAVQRLLPAPGTESFADRVMQRVQRRSRRSRRQVPPRRSRRRVRSLPVLPMVGAAILLLAVIGLHALRQASAPESVDTAPVAAVEPVLWRVLSGDAVVVGPDGDPRFDDALRLGDELRANSAAVSLRRSDGTRLRIDPGAVVVATDGTSVELLSGRLEAEVTPQRKHPFSVRAPHATAEVVGTRFAVVAASGVTTVAVDEGKVRVKARDFQHLVTAGEVLSFPDPQQAIRTVALVEAPGGRILKGYERIEDGRNLLLRELPTEVNFVVGVADEIEALRTVLRDDAGRELGGSVEQSMPFTVFGDDGHGNLERWNLQPGSYRLRIEAYTNGAAEGEPREVRVLGFTVSMD